jgi:hypothetical protein
MTALLLKPVLWECVQEVAANCSSPIESVSLIEQDLVELGGTSQAGGRADKTVDVLKVRIQATIIRKKQSPLDAATLPEKEKERCPTASRGGAFGRKTSQVILFGDFFGPVTLGQIIRRQFRNGTLKCKQLVRAFDANEDLFTLKSAFRQKPEGLLCFLDRQGDHQENLIEFP